MPFTCQPWAETLWASEKTSSPWGPPPHPQSHPKGTREQVLPAQPNGTFTIERAQVNQKPRDPQDRSNDFSLLFIYSDQ